MDEEQERKWPHAPRARANGKVGAGDIASRIREARVRANLTQKDLADAFGLSTRAIQEWEQGRINPEYRHGAKLAEVLGVDLEWLTKGTQPEEAGASVVEAMKSQLLEQGEELTILRRRMSLLEEKLDRVTKPA